MRVLLVRLSAMGDVVHALGAIEALALARPELELCVVTQRAYTPLLEGMPLATVIAHDRRPPLRGLLAVARRVRALRADVAVDLQGNWKSALIARASAARLRIGARAAERREPASAVLLNRRIACGAPHPASQAFALLRQLAPDLAPRLPRLRARADAVDAEARALAAAGIGAARPFRVLVLTDPRDPRSWPAAALEREARASPLPALVLAGCHGRVRCRVCATAPASCIA
jgi:heptosyltransferase-1